MIGVKKPPHLGRLEGMGMSALLPSPMGMISVLDRAFKGE
jgi:hypothetical protein